ncbi:MAG: AIR synthase-related protein, partial [Syntrophales bacterium LBB04]|nr:AIR synthase-related protein [Syntrophales bacterium LBB04]
LVEGSDDGLIIQAGSVPYFQGVRDLAETGIIPAGLQRNRNFRLPMLDVAPGCPAWLLDILFDPQTSGGLFIAVAGTQAKGLLARMHAAGLAGAAIVGEVAAEPRGRIRVV